MRLVITAGPTQEPIDAVRYLGNRSSGRLGIALACEAAGRGHDVTLLLGPTPRQCDDSRVRVVRFRTTADLQLLLREAVPACDALIMAAAVADYRPVVRSHAGAPPIDPSTHKLPRQGGPLSIDLVPTPDLLAERVQARRPGQVFVGFALEPRERLVDSARAKLARKGVDMIVANPLETMDAETIEATLVHAGGAVEPAGSMTSKEAFAPWLLDRVERLVADSGAPAAPRRARC